MELPEATAHSKADLCDTNVSQMQRAARCFRDKYNELVELYIEAKLELHKLRKRN